MSKVKIDQEMVSKKAKKVGEIIDNVTLPNVLSILGAVIVEIIINAKGQGYDIVDVVDNWLKHLCKSIHEILPDNDHDENFAN